MRKTAFLFTFLFATVSLMTFAQVSTTNFEVHTYLKYPKMGSGGMRSYMFNKDSILSRLNAIPDTATTVATFVYTNSGVSQLDSVILKLEDSQANQVLNSTTSIAVLTQAGKVRIDGNTIFIKVGAFPYLKRFTAKLTPIYNGVLGAELTFSKTQ